MPSPMNDEPMKTLRVVGGGGVVLVEVSVVLSPGVRAVDERTGVRAIPIRPSPRDTRRGGPVELCDYVARSASDLGPPSAARSAM